MYTGNSTEYYIMTYMGKEAKRKREYMCIYRSTYNLFTLLYSRNTIL